MEWMLLVLDQEITDLLSDMANNCWKKSTEAIIDELRVVKSSKKDTEYHK